MSRLWARCGLPIMSWTISYSAEINHFTALLQHFLLKLFNIFFKKNYCKNKMLTEIEAFRLQELSSADVSCIAGKPQQWGTHPTIFHRTGRF